MARKTIRYIDCPTDGRQLFVRFPYETPIRFGENKGQPITLYRHECPVCRDTYPNVVSIRVRTNGNRGKCGGACLNGKTSCDCKCNGRCHGAGRCQCEEITVSQQRELDEAYWDAMNDAHSL